MPEENAEEIDIRARLNEITAMTSTPKTGEIVLPVLWGVLAGFGGFVITTIVLLFTAIAVAEPLRDTAWGRSAGNGETVEWLPMLAFPIVLVISALVAIWLFRKTVHAFRRATDEVASTD